ncbi:MAG TPA: membrane protein insertion efficiency factor YidD [Gammaproteobacteria bacterium]|nr:membrane protein insertion efficiency factor YidD [Gammaproteobacteria bacterium]
MLREFVLRAIARYRETGGGQRWFGVECNFEPSCSAYAQQAIGRYGLYRGAALAWNRIRRCNVRDSVCKCLESLPEDLNC